MLLSSCRPITPSWKPLHAWGGNLPNHTVGSPACRSGNSRCSELSFPAVVFPGEGGMRMPRRRQRAGGALPTRHVATNPHGARGQRFGCRFRGGVRRPPTHPQHPRAMPCTAQGTQPRRTTPACRGFLRGGRRVRHRSRSRAWPWARTRSCGLSGCPWTT